MSVTRNYKDVKVNGAPLTTVLGPEIIAGRIKLATDEVTSFAITIADTPDLHLTTDVTRIFREGTVIEWEEFTFAVTGLSTGGGSKMPTIDVVATSDFVDELDEQKGESNWDTEDVSAWAKKTIESTGAKAVVQPGLGSRTIERKENEDNPEDGESTWDVMVNLAKRVGAWVFEYGDSIIFGKPTWLAGQGGVNVYKLTWNSWTDHSPSLLEAPVYTWDKETKPYEGQETLTLRMADPAKGGNFHLSKLRPGNMITFEGKGAHTDDPVWIVRSVEHQLVVGEPMSVLCWRPLDPPEVQDDEGTSAGGGTSTSGVPDGPIGQSGWNGEQLKNAAEIVAESQRRGLPLVAAEIAVMTAMQESSLRNLKHGDEIYGVTNPDGQLTTSVGLFQQQDPWGSRADRLSPGKSAGLFYNRMLELKLDYKNVRDGMAAGRIAQTVQVSGHPDAYAKHWNDAKLVVAACVEAGKAANDGAAGGKALKAPGELGKKIDELMASYEGQSIDVDGQWGAQCYDLAQKYLTALTGIGMIQANGKDFWNHPQLLSHFTPVAANKPPRRGDISSWRAYSFKGEGAEYGHVAIYAGPGASGGDMHLSQNPGKSSTRWLPRAGIQGWMRPRSK